MAGYHSLGTPRCTPPAMRTMTLSVAIRLPQPLDTVFPFFADARNLEILTPPWLHFQVLTPEPIRMAAGTRIDYRLRLRGIPLRWQSEIAEWDPPHQFTDIQTRGPYRLWHHVHRFIPDGRGTLCEDKVTYSPLGGRIVDRLLVRPDLNRIFEFRHAMLRRRFKG